MTAPTYKNQQLRAVSLETYFRGRLGFREAATRVQNAVDARLPNLYVPNSKPGQPIDLQPYQLRDDDSTESLALAANQVAYISHDYAGHGVFKTRAIGLIEPALKELGVQTLLRVIYRYENEIAITRDDREVIPLDKILKVPGRPWWQGDALTEISASWSQATMYGRLGIRIAVEPGQPVEKLLVSIASVVIPAGPVTALETYVAQSHATASEWFEGAITDEFRAYIKGEPDA